MTDTYGAIDLPAAAGEFGQGYVDPVLSAIGGYLKAVLPVKLGSSWASVAPGEKLISHVFHVKPQEALVNASQLPGLFVWRGPFTQNREGDDYLLTRTQLGLMWLLWWDQPIKREKRLPFVGAVVAAIHSALARGRDPAWVVAGDTTEGAATRGSVLMQQAGLFEPIEKIQGSEADVVLDPDKSGNPVAYKALSLTIQICERMTRDPALFSVPTISTSDPANADAGAGYPQPAALDLTVLQSDDNTTEQLQPLS